MPPKYKMPPPPRRRMILPREQMFERQPPAMPPMPQGNIAPFRPDREMDDEMAKQLQPPMPGRTGLSNIPMIMRHRKLRTVKR